MGIKAFFKGLSLFLQIAIVIGAVVAIAFFLGWFAPVKHTLKDTPITIKSIREIGQLITAEYYGEVLSSYRNKILDDVYMKADTLLFPEFTDIDGDFNIAVRSSARNITRRVRNRDLDTFKNDNRDILGNTYFNLYLKYQKEVFDVKNTDRFYKQLLGDTSKLDMLLSANDLIDQYIQEQTDLLFEEKKFRKQQIIMLGRGWVKAGFDFQKFSERNFHYDKTHKRIYFFGLKPRILSHTINPWFIPEKNIKGFEIIMATRKAKYGWEEMEQTKQKCLDLLLEEALANDILDIARNNAEENLKIFFSVLLDEDIESVSFINESLSYYLTTLLQNDTTLTQSELFLIDSLQIKNITNPLLPAFIDSLQKLQVRYDSGIIKMNRYLPLANSILWADDGIDFGLDTSNYYEYRILEDYKTYIDSDSLNTLDSLWFYSTHKRDSLQKKYSQTFTQLQYLFQGKRSELEEKHKKNTENILFNIAKRNQIQSYNESLKFLLDNCVQIGNTELNDSLRIEKYNALKANPTLFKNDKLESY